MITATGLTKRFGQFTAVDRLDFAVGNERIAHFLTDFIP